MLSWGLMQLFVAEALVSEARDNVGWGGSGGQGGVGGQGCWGPERR